VLESLARQNINIPVILMTFHGSEEIAVEMFRLGVRDYVKKPYTPEEMLEAIEASLTEARLRKEKDALTSRLLSANRDLHSRVKELNTLYSIGKSVTAQLNLTQLLPRIVEAATVLTSAEQASLVLIEDDGLVLRAVKRRGDAHARAASDPVDDPFVERAIQSGQTVLLTPAELIKARQHNPNAPVASVMVPLQSNNRVIGVLSAENLSANTRPFSDHDAGLLSALSDYATIGLQTARQSQVTRRPAATAAQPEVGTAEEATRRQVTVLAADLRGYGPAFNDMHPDTAVGLLNEYLGFVTAAMTERGASIERAFGDTILGIFETIQGEQDHLAHAMDTGLILQEEVARLNAQYKLSLSFGVGISTGDAIFGMMGDTYAAIGDVVNTARRLQELAEPGQILVDGSISKLVHGQIGLVAMGRLKIKGVNTPVNVYAVKT
jgi:class 3 adenylate cyclase